MHGAPGAGSIETASTGTEQYTLKVRRFKPEEGEGPYWQEFEVELDPTLSVLDGLLQSATAKTARSRCAARAGRRSVAPVG